MSNLLFKVEQWTSDDMHVDEVVAVSVNVLVARAAWEAAVELRPSSIMRLRHGSRVICEHLPDT